MSDNACQHCAQNDQWCSHGYVYKQETIEQRTAIGKRILCSNRDGKTGCGRTRQLYLASVIPHKHYRLAVVLAFISALLKGGSVTDAYRAAVGQTALEARHAWRWLQGLFDQLGHWRTRLPRGAESPIDRKRHCPRLQVLLPTLQRLLQDDQPIQQTYQQALF